MGGEKRGIIASASYEARKLGVYTPMPTVRARKLCPKLIVLPGDYDRYEHFSRWMFSYAYDFTPDVERTSIDEGYFDLTANHKKPAIEIALTISKANLTLSLYPVVNTPALSKELFFSPNIPEAEFQEYFSKIQDESYFAFWDMLFLNLPHPKRVKGTPINYD